MSWYHFGDNWQFQTIDKCKTNFFIIKLLNYTKINPIQLDML